MTMIRRCDMVPQYEAHAAEIDAAIHGVLRSGRYVLGENVEAFEHEFSTYLGSPFGVGVNSGTDALLLALSAFGIKPGDEVITTPFTAIPTYSAIRHTRATPVFADIDPRTFLMDLGAVERALTPRTRAVVAVHLFGNAIDVEALRTIVGPDVYILEDCAQSHGAMVRGKRAGSLGDAAAFSFYPTKNLGGYGDGGMVTTHRKEIADSVRLRRMYGMITKDEFIVDGINSRLDELQAAILRVKLRHLDAMNAARCARAALYAARLPEEVQPQSIQPGIDPVHHVYAALCADRRDELLASLDEQGIQTNVYYPMPLTRQEAYRRAFPGSTPAVPAADDVSARILALPMYPELSESAIEHVAAAICRFYAR